MMLKIASKIITYLFCFSIVFSSLHLFAQDSKSVKFVSAVEKEFKKALSQYISKDYRSAFVRFETLSNSQILHHRMTATLLMTGKSLYHLARYDDALPYFDRLINSFQQSKYVDDAYYARASCNYRLSQGLKAVKDLLWILDWSSEQSLVSKSKSLASFIMRSDLSRSELQNLLQYTNGETSSALVAMELAKEELLGGSNEKAAELLNEYKVRYGSNEFISQIDQLLREAEGSSSLAVKVGVILPLTGYFSEEGLGVLRGIKFANMQDNNSSRPIQLAVRDSKSNMINAIQGVKSLIGTENVRAIIGELESEITAGIGALAAIEKIPVIAPTASENDVASVGKTVYQLNSDLERKGRALAEYAIQRLGLRTFATLAPADEYGQQMTASFTSVVDQLGGRIIAQGWYYGTPQDLSRQFENIRQAAFHYDSTDVEEMIRIAKEKGQDLEKRDIPVLSIDGIFLPVYSEDIKYVAPQLALHNIQTQILGGEYLDNLEILKAGQIEPYISGAIFVSDYFPDEDNRAFRNFRSDFRIKMKKSPERWEVFGYDAYRIISEAINNGAKTAQEINQKLNQLSGYEGKKGKISFQGNSRVNKEVNFLQFINGKIVKHQN